MRSDPSDRPIPEERRAAGVPMPQPRDDVRLMAGYHSPLVDVAVRLNVNESPWPPPAGWRHELAAAVASLDAHRYPDREATGLRRALGDLHGVGADQIFCANGSNEVIQSVLLAYGGHGRTAVVFDPTYELHAHIARITGTAVVRGERGLRFELDLGEVRRVAADALADVVFLCSPNNPTGRADTLDEISEVVSVAPGLVVVDEAYGQFAPQTALELLPGEERVVVLRTFSKTWSMAALRLGYLVGAPEIVAALERVALPYHLDALKQAAGRVAIAYQADMHRRVAAIVAERERLMGALGDLAVDLWPSDANFILFRPRTSDAGQVWQGLVDRSVLVRDVSTRPRLEGCLRVSVGTPEENDAFVAALKEVTK